MPLTIDDSTAQWSAPPAERAGRPLVVLMHGYGSNENDLIGLVPELPSEPVYVSLRAPLTAPWPIDGFSWYPLGEPSAPEPEPVTAAAASVLTWLAPHAEAASAVGVAGFSQGGAMSLQLLRLAPETLSFAINLSGYASPGELPGDEILLERRPPVFWGRGTADEVIPESAIVRTTDWLPSRSTLSGRIYEGLAHAVSAEEIADVREFIRRGFGL